MMSPIEKFVRPGALLAIIAIATSCTEPKPKPTAIVSATPTTMTAVVGGSIAVAPAVRVTDDKGNSVGGVAVTFAVTAGGGTLGSTTATSGDDGNASSGSWKLGTTAGVNTVTASVEGLTGSPVTFTATGTPGPAASITLNQGDGQTATTNTPVLISPSVLVFDAHGNPVGSTSVVFTVTGGGGSVTGSPATTSSAGLATVGSWTLGSGVGVNALTASVIGVSSTVTFTATSTAPVASLSVAMGPGDRQAVMTSSAVVTKPSVTVTSGGAPAAGVTVTFSAITGGGSVTGGTATTDANGVATVGSWTLGTTPGLNTLSANVTGSNVAGNPITFTASACTGGGANYKLTLCFTSDMTASQKAAFESAAARWETVITADLPDGAFSSTVAAGLCGPGSFSVAAGQTIDDLMIFASVRTIDGPGGVLGSAGGCGFRASKLSLLGSMSFDAADLSSMETSGILNSVILHEMGHVIGLGGQWGGGAFGFNLLVNPSAAGSQLDTHYSGTNGIEGFNTIGGSTYTGGNKVPVHNVGGAGSINSHWRESVLQNELMSPTIGGSVNPLSALTVESLRDLGYTVNSSAADPFFLSLAVVAPGPSTKRFDLTNDAYMGPQFIVDAQGRITRIR